MFLTSSSTSASKMVPKGLSCGGAPCPLCLPLGLPTFVFLGCGELYNLGGACCLHFSPTTPASSVVQSTKSGYLAIPTSFASSPASPTMSSTYCILRSVHALRQYPRSSRMSNGAVIRYYHLCTLLGLIAAQIAQANRRFC